MWILFLVLLIVMLSYIMFGALLKRELSGGDYKPIISEVSKVILFISEIPSNLKSITKDDLKLNKVRTRQYKAEFDGMPSKKECYLLLSRYDGDLRESVIELVDLRDFSLLYTWNPDINAILDSIAVNNWKNMEEDNPDNRYRIKHPVLSADGAISFAGGPFFKIDKRSKVEWLLPDVRHHHSLEVDENGNYWSPITFRPAKIPLEYSKDINDFYDDGIRQISFNGDVIYEKIFN